MSYEDASADEYEDADDIPQPGNDLNEDEGSDDGEEVDGEDDDSENGGDTGGGSDSDEPAGPNTYVFSESDSLLYVQVWKDESAWASDYAHDHVIRAGLWDGTMTYDSSDPSRCELLFDLPVAELLADEPGMRELVGYSEEVNDGDREEIRENMLSSDQLNADAYPTIWFESVSCDGAGGESGSLTVTGDLNVHGTSARVSFPVDFQLSGTDFYAQGSIQVDHSDFGMDVFEAYWGLVKNDEPLDFAFDMVGHAL